MSNPGDYYETKRRDAAQARQTIQIVKADIAATEDPELLISHARVLLRAAKQLDLALYVGD